MEAESFEPLIGIEGFSPLDYPLLAKFWAKQETLLGKAKSMIQIMQELQREYGQHLSDFEALGLTNCISNADSLSNALDSMNTILLQIQNCQNGPNGLDRLFRYARTVDVNEFKRRKGEAKDAQKAKRNLFF